MALVQRGYGSRADLSAVGSLIRGCWLERPYFNAWTFARWDIWAQRRLAAVALEGDAAWQDDLALWTDDAGTLVGAAFIGEGPNDGVLVLDAGSLAIAPALVDWVEARYEAGGSDEPLLIEVNASNPRLGELLAARGYARIEGHFIPRRKRLLPGESPVELPTGFRIETVHDEDLARRRDAVYAVFGRGGTVEAFRWVLRAPSAEPKLGLIVSDESGRVVSFCNVWVERTLGISEFEPVGTVPTHEKLGLASAVMTEGENRLRRLGVAIATVHSWSEAEPANRLYDRLGYERVDRQENWQRS